MQPGVCGGEGVAGCEFCAEKGEESIGVECCDRVVGHY